ncbi:MAG: hypothetical protein KZQ56_11260, partial [gamma proteobacterium symbiont of Lucinoma myriamae]|nr:hypothetical protein [gamma proteobacterium symbiont of Lucinoma myriamae]
ITVSEPPIADPHDGWCGGCRRETCGYPIEYLIYPQEVFNMIFAAYKLEMVIALVMLFFPLIYWYSFIVWASFR